MAFPRIAKQSCGNRMKRRQDRAGSSHRFANALFRRISKEEASRPNSARSARNSHHHFWFITWIPTGVMMTMNSTGRKKIIMGTVSFGGSAAAFFSASIMR